MEINGDIFQRLRDPDYFIALFKQHTAQVIARVQLSTNPNNGRLRSAHQAWLKDIDRLGDELPTSGADGKKATPDQYKHAAYLAFWLRREKPVAALVETDEVYDWTQHFSHITAGEDCVVDVAGYSRERAHDFKSVILECPNEFLGFNMGFEICRFFFDNQMRSGTMPHSGGILEMPYIADTCYYLKYKNVSPQAIYLIYKGIFSSFEHGVRRASAATQSPR